MAAHTDSLFLNRRSQVRFLPGAPRTEADSESSCGGQESCAHTKLHTTEQASCVEDGLTDARARLLSVMVGRVEAEVGRIDPLLLSFVWRCARTAGIPAMHSCRVAPSPLCVCGHGRARHLLDFNDGDTCEPWCDCFRFRDVRSSVETSRGWSSCSDLCNCGGSHTEGRVYFVSAMARRWREGRAAMVNMLLLGPFACHSTALDMVDEGRRLAEKRYARADESSYGTCSLPGDTKQIGVLDERYVAPVSS